MKNNTDKHIDSQIKKSFDSLQKKAPVHLWDNISEHLNSNQSIDQSIDNKVQDSFINHQQSSAPAFLWGAINEGLENAETDFNDSLDKKLKNSYDQQETSQTPDSVWFAINRQLNIDNTWNKISKVLDSNPVVSDWRNKIFKFMAAASVMLLFVKSCVDNPTPQNVHYVYSDNISLSKNAKDNEDKTITTLPSEENSLIIERATDPDDNSLVSAVSDDEDSVNNNNNTDNKPLVIENKISATKTQNSNEDFPSVNNSNIVADEGNNSLYIDNNSSNEKVVADSQNTSTDPQKKVAEENVFQYNYNLSLLNVIKTDALAFDSKFEPVLLSEEFTLENKNKNNLIEGKLQAGAFVVVNATMLLNNETKEGFDENSLVQNYYGLAANYGIWASYRLIPKGEIVAEFSINADNKQANGVFEKGDYYIKEWVMKYNRISLAYKHDLWSSGKPDVVNTKIVAQGGFYIGFLREAKLFYDGELKYDLLQEHHNFDFGFKVALGQEIIFDKFVLGYGLRSDIGVANIFKGNSTLSSRENNTNIIHLGGYCMIGYRF